MPKPAGRLLTRRGVVAFWLLVCTGLRAHALGGIAGRARSRTHSRRNFCKIILPADTSSETRRSTSGCSGRCSSLVGTGPLSYLLLRYALIAAIGILFYVALRRTVPEPRLAAAFSLSLLLFYWFGWEVHHSVSHSLVLLVLRSPLHRRAGLCRERPMALAHLISASSSASGSWPNGASLLAARWPWRGARADGRATRRLYRDPRTLLVLSEQRCRSCPSCCGFDSAIWPRRQRAVPQEAALSTGGHCKDALVFLDRHPARVPSVDRLRAVLRLALPENATVNAGHCPKA